MTDNEFFLIVGYLASKSRNSVIEVEIPYKDKARFEKDYAGMTGGSPLPTDITTAPYYVWPDGTNKWGIEGRIYFVSSNSMPTTLDALLEPSKVQNRPGYENWKRRISTKSFVYRLLEHGFVIGDSQDPTRIRSTVPASFLTDFDNGFSL